MKNETMKPEVPSNFNAGLAITVSIPRKIEIMCAPDRIFCVRQDANFMQTSSGLKVSTTIGQMDPDGKKEQQGIKRYFVVAVGQSAGKIKYLNEKKKKIKIRRGDELIFAMNPDSTAYFPPEVTDFASLGKNGEPVKYYAFDKYEVAGVIRHKLDFSGDYTGLRKWIYRIFKL
jgi:hypothetical protein